MIRATLKMEQWQINAEIDSSFMVNFALHRCKVPVIRRISIANSGETVTSPLMIAVSIEGYSDSWLQETRPLSPGEEVILDNIDLKLDHTRLEGQSTRSRAFLVIKINGVLLHKGEIDILGFYEWPTGAKRSHQKTLACFVQPGNPFIQDLFNHATRYLQEKTGFYSHRDLLSSGRPNPTEIALRSIYETLLSHYHILYDAAPAWSYERGSQIIRPPHRVVSHFQGTHHKYGLGRGTCIDLCVMIAAGLENILLKPVIAVVRSNGNIHHALAGCWLKKSGKSLELFIGYEKMKSCLERKELILIDPAGFTVQQRLKFEKAVERAMAYINDEGKFIFAIDIAAARENELMPLQFGMSPGLIGALRDAESLALQGKGHCLDSKHLLFALFLSDMENSPLLEEALERAAIPLDESRRILRGMIERGQAGHKLDRRSLLTKTTAYRCIIEDMTILSHLEGPGLIDRTHLMVALFRSRCQDVKRILDRAGIHTERALSASEETFPWLKRISRFEAPSPAAGMDKSSNHITLSEALDIESLALDLKLPAKKTDLHLPAETAAHPKMETTLNGPREIGRLTHKGIALVKSRLYDKALKTFDMALELDHEELTALNGKGYCLLGLGWVERALDFFESALKQDAIDPDALVGRALVLYELGQLDQGGRDIDLALSVHPRIPALWYHRAESYLHTGHFEKALDCLHLALEMFISREMKTQASLLLDKSLKHFPEDLRLHQLQGWTSRMGGVEEEALLDSRMKLETIHKNSDENDTETTGLLAGTYKRLWLLNQVKYFDLLQKSFDLYHDAWIWSGRRNTYVGINAAAMALILGMRKESVEIAREILGFYRNKDLTNLPRVGPKFSSYWYRATQAEAELLLGRLGRARALYADIMALYKNKEAYVQSSLDQIDLILPQLGLTINASQFLNRPIFRAKVMKATLGVIGATTQVPPEQFVEKLRTALAVIRRLLPEGISSEVLTGLMNLPEKICAGFLMDEKGADLRVVRPSEEIDFLLEREDRAQIQGLLNRAEELISLDERHEPSSEVVDHFILRNSDILIVIRDDTAPVLRQTILSPRETKKRPVIYISADRDCETTYENLDETLNMSFLKGERLMYDPKPMDTTRIELSEDLLDLTELLAENNHDVWASERIKEGWKYGPKRDDGAKEHPDIIPYSELPDSEKEYDRRTAMETLKAIVSLGYRIERVGKG